ncbi:MAG: RNA polymerase sigma factor [Phycisphaerae bacterium]
MDFAQSADALFADVTEARRGDRSAAERIIRAHESWVRSIIFGVVGRAEHVDDIAQQVWTQVWQRLSTLENPKRLRSWLYSIARHAAIDYGIANKRRSRRFQTTGEWIEVPESKRSESAPADKLARRELHDVLMDAIAALPRIYREPFALRHLEGWTYAQIGELMEMPIETVETRLVRARRLLRESLSGLA